MLFKLECLYKSTGASIGFLWKDGDFSLIRQPTLFDQNQGRAKLDEWRGMKWLSHLKFRLVAEPEETVESLEATLEDEEAGHTETLELLRVMRVQRDELQKQNDALRAELEMRDQTIRELKTDCDNLRRMI